MIPAGRTQAIYGDANAQAATVVPDLAAGADNQALSVSANSDELNFNQKLDLNDLIYDTNTEEVYASVISAGQVAILGNFMGWVDCSKIYLEVDCGFKFTNIFRTSQTTESFTWPVVDTKDFNDGECFYRCSFPNFSMLQPLIRLTVQMGENNQIIGRQQMNYLQGIKLVAQDYKYQPEEVTEMCNIGCPRSR
jgi:hypothetical protein